MVLLLLPFPMILLGFAVTTTLAGDPATKLTVAVCCAAPAVQVRFAVPIVVLDCKVTVAIPEPFVVTGRLVTIVPAVVVQFTLCPDTGLLPASSTVMVIVVVLAPSATMLLLVGTTVIFAAAPDVNCTVT